MTLAHPVYNKWQEMMKLILRLTISSLILNIYKIKYIFAIGEIYVEIVISKHNIVLYFPIMVDG